MELYIQNGRWNGCNDFHGDGCNINLKLFVFRRFIRKTSRVETDILLYKNANDEVKLEVSSKQAAKGYGERDIIKSLFKDTRLRGMQQMRAIMNRSKSYGGICGSHQSP